MLASIYTYNPITKIGHCEDTSKPLIVVGTGEY